MSDETFVTNYLKDLGSLIPKLDTAKIATAIEWMRTVRDAGNTIYICGNGGSTSIASQMVVDIVKCASLRKKARFKMVSLADNIATLTAYANDEGYETIFVEPLRNFSQPGDLLIAISGSGNSENVLQAVAFANESNCKTIGLTTDAGGRLRELAQLPLLVPSNHMGRLEDCFFILTHILCYAFIEAE